MKKIISLLLVLVVVLGCVGLAACGGGGGAVPTTENGQPTTGGEEPSNGGGNGGGNGNGGGGGNGGEESLGEILGHGTGIDSVSYVMETSGAGTPMMTAQVWVKRNKMRMEMTEQEQMIYLANYDTGKAYMYMPDQNMAIEIDISQVNPPDYENAQDIPNYHPTIIGTETMDGKVCLVVEYSYGGATVKSWIWKEHGFPIRTETTTPQGTVIVVFRDISFSDINDSMFELPSGVQIVHY
jgi:outer membrane lipoprotein-sorting protein